MKINVEYLKLLLAEQNLTQKRLSKLSGISRQSICNILAKGSCSPTSLIKIAKALDVEPQELIKTED
ncbi:MAG: helix-turn-helix transcriptional regulator [Saccharofermentanales bacterium]